MAKRKQSKLFEDSFIREVRVNYVSTDATKFKISDPRQIASFVRLIMVDNSREQFFSLYLDANHQVASYSIISIGTANQATVHAREVFQRAILSGAIAIALAHNHPSGSLEVSSADVETTKRLAEAGKLLGIHVLDHVIVTETSYVSLREDSRYWPV